MARFGGRFIMQALAVLAVAAAMTGCTTYQQQNKFSHYYQRGDLVNAEIQATKKAEDKANSKDAIIWRLEEGAILRAAGKFDASNKAFDKAEERINQYQQQAKVKIASEAESLISNQANLPYRGRGYDGIMVNTYKALNYLQLNQPDNARVELTRTYERQKDIVEENKKRIEKTQEEVSKSGDKEKIEKARQDPRFNSELTGAYSEMDKHKAYADYVNPFSVYLSGLFYALNPSGASDLERARVAFERVATYVDNPYVKDDLKIVDSLINGQKYPPTTYVIFETGRAPWRDQLRIDVPIIVTDVSYVGAAFPILRFADDYVPQLNVVANGANAPTVLVGSMDSVVTHDFKTELPSIITKTIAATITKGVAAYAANHAAMQADNTIGWVIRVATAGLQAVVNIADLRTWTTLPKEFQICHVPTPPDRKIELNTAYGGQRITVTVGEGTVNLVYVKSISPYAPLLITQTKLK